MHADRNIFIFSNIQCFRLMSEKSENNKVVVETASLREMRINRSIGSEI
jgi:hypothetical protein